MSSSARVRMSAAARREQVLAAAIAEFATGGFAATSTESIARRAEISQAYLFRLFPTKKSIFLAATNHAFDAVEVVFRSAAAQSGEADRWDAMADAYIEMLSDRQSLVFQLQVYAAAGLDDEIRDLARDRFHRLYQLVRDLFGTDSGGALDFMAQGMLLNVTSALDLELLEPPADE
ncbi:MULTISPECIES: TetR/AcrR family transcriptional regulator [unclassified Nocardia]|uniref:TetR/AcrR family transcriptional regulator n=1 Tax=unclassified Nocardia TaxID=2637762 RepID=UPI0035DA856B